MYVCMQSFVQICAGIAPGPDPPNQQGNRVLEAGQEGNLPRVPRGGSTPAVDTMRPAARFFMRFFRLHVEIDIRLIH